MKEASGHGKAPVAGCRILSEKGFRRGVIHVIYGTIQKIPSRGIRGCERAGSHNYYITESDQGKPYRACVFVLRDKGNGKDDRSEDICEGSEL